MEADNFPKRSISWPTVAAWLIPTLISCYAISISNKGAPDYYAAPDKLSYCYTESNLLENHEPKQGTLTLKITNHDSTPARDVRAVVIPISDNPKITADQKYEVQEGPFDTRIIRIDRIPPHTTAIIDIVEGVVAYPENFGMTPGKSRPKYQYFPQVVEIQTEFGQIKCDYGRYMRNCLRLPDDGGFADNFVGPKALEDVTLKIGQEN